MTTPIKDMISGKSIRSDWDALMIRDGVALAIYKVDHPDYTDSDMGMVPLLATVQHYRRLADAAIAAATPNA